MVKPLTSASEPEQLKAHVHAEWLCGAGMFVAVNKGVHRITNQGHDYLAAIRDDTVWRKPQNAAASVGGAALGMMKDPAIALLKQELADKVGIRF